MVGDMQFVLGLKPQAAIEWLRTKNVTAENYRNLTASEIAKVYTIARIADLDMLNDIKQSMIVAADNGVPFEKWKQNVLQHFANKGWLHPNEHNGVDIIDPNTGEVFGSPRRLENIYRTNMQSAFMAGRYQAMMANIDSRPYWQYDAVGDSRTRPAHAAMDGLVYRYDDAFWTTFYPPNGYRCRCSVIALSERDMTQQGLSLSESTSDNLVPTHKIYNKKGDSYPTMAFKSPDGRLHTTDKGFDYNAGRMNYRPNLDNYDRGLAHEFAKAEMSGSEFQAAFKQLSEEFDEVKNRLGFTGKLTDTQKIQIRNTLSRQLKFAAGVLSKEVQQQTGLKRATVWLSDDTLVKQVDSRKGQEFGAEVYGLLPDTIYDPEYIFRDGKKYILVRQNRMSVIKYLEQESEIFLQSYRRIGKDELKKLIEKKEIIKTIW